MGYFQGRGDNVCKMPISYSTYSSVWHIHNSNNIQILSISIVGHYCQFFIIGPYTVSTSVHCVLCYKLGSEIKGNHLVAIFIPRLLSERVVSLDSALNDSRSITSNNSHVTTIIQKNEFNRFSMIVICICFNTT